MKRFLTLGYGVVSYAAFFATILYAIGFIGNILVPRAIDSVPQVPLGHAVAINMALLTLFAVQHSVMARPFFKRWIVRFMPQSIERSTFVLASSAALMLLFGFWEPMGGVIWQLRHPLAVTLMWTGYALGWGLVFLSTFLINHFDLFGLRQVWLAFRDRPYSPLEFGTPFLYRMVRHPLYLGFIFAMWFTPTMTLAHLLFAVGTTGYIFAGIRLEERDLLEAHPEYREYQRKVPMIFPSLRRPVKPVEAAVEHG